MCSRREAEKLLIEGKINVNGKIVRELGTKIDPEHDIVKILSSNNSIRKETVAVYKPRGVVSSSNKSEGVTIYATFPQLSHLNVVGRLDKESEGLLLLSNDGLVTKAITSDAHTTEKEYVVKVRETIRPNMLQKMRDGIVLNDGKTLPAKASRIDEHTFTIILREGKNHQIRRMTNALKLTVGTLKRVRIGSIGIDTMTPGSSRILSKKEVLSLKDSR